MIFPREMFIVSGKENVKTEFKNYKFLYIRWMTEENCSNLSTLSELCKGLSIFVCTSRKISKKNRIE